MQRPFLTETQVHPSIRDRIGAPNETLAEVQSAVKDAVREAVEEAVQSVMREVTDGQEPSGK